MTSVLVESSMPPQVETWKQGQTKPGIIQYTGEAVEVQLRHVTQTKMIRVSEYFKDFDSLRSGFITNQRFRRCLNEQLGLTISDIDHEYLVQKYGQEKPGMINYKAFEEAMEKNFNPYLLDGQPGGQIEKFERTTKPTFPETLTEEEKMYTEYLLRKCHDYYQSRGINVKSCYCDFDRHQRGFVTESQFHRSFPGPSDVSPENISALSRRYFDASNGLYNYIKFHKELISAGARDLGRSCGPPLPPPQEPPPLSSPEEILKRIRDAVYLNGIRTTDFFIDHDKLRSGLVTKNQFVNGLSMSCGTVAHLSKEDVEKVADYYKNPDGYVQYKEFCHLMEHDTFLYGYAYMQDKQILEDRLRNCVEQAYNEPDLEKKPLTNIYRPLRGHLKKPLATLPTSNDEQRLQEILKFLSYEVKTKRIMLYPYFRDFDRGKGYTRGVTKPQFERILHIFSLNIPPEDMKLLESRFMAANGIDINYEAFVQSIDQLFVGQVKEAEGTPQKSVPPSHTQQPLTPSEVTMLISRLREFVCCHRIRVTEHFQDFDLLRSGSISTIRFRQGLTSIGKPYLTDSQFQALCELFSDPKQKEHVLWKKFVSTLEDPVLASAVSIPRPVPLPVLRPGAVDFCKVASEEDLKCLQDVLHRLREKTHQRRILVRDVFQDFDRNCIGYVTCSQLRQCLDCLGLECSDQEYDVIRTAFSDQKGVHYLDFLHELDPQELVVDKYRTKRTLIKELEKEKAALHSDGSSVPLQEVLDGIKAKVYRRRILVHEFMKDYDKLRCGSVSLNIFSRAMDVCGLHLTQQELLTLQRSFPSDKVPDGVDYMTFSDEIESVFTTKGLEKNPTAELELFIPLAQGKPISLIAEDEQIADKAMHKLAEKVRQRRIQLFPLFEDYDRVNIGTVSRGQFRRVLNELELAGLVSDFEFGILFHKFQVTVGGREDVDYIAFSHMCNDYAQKMWPAEQTL